MRRFVAWLLLLLGAGAVGGGALWWRDQQRFIATAAVADGTVTELRRSGSRSNTMAPVVVFRTASGQQVTWVSATSSNPPAYRVGERVRMQYDPANPSSAQIEGSFLARFGSFIPIGIGALLLLVGLALGPLRRRRTASVPASGPAVQALGNRWPTARPAPAGAAATGWVAQQPPVARQVRERVGLGAILLKLFGAGAIAGALAMGAAGVAALADAREFDAAAQPGMAEVIALVPGDGGLAPRFMVRLNDGRRIEATSPIAASPPAFAVGDKAAVRFTLGDPPRIQPEGSFAQQLHWVFFGAAGVLLALGVVLLRWQSRRARG
jgi:hypothetical protein